MDSQEAQLSIAEKPLGIEGGEAEPRRPLCGPARVVQPIGQLLIEAGLIGEAGPPRAPALPERPRRRLGSHPLPPGGPPRKPVLSLPRPQPRLPPLPPERPPPPPPPFVRP